MHVALNGSDDHFAFGFGHLTGAFFVGDFFRFYVRNQMRHRLFHDPRRFNHLWQKHFALAKQIAHHVHAVHQRPFNDVYRAATGFRYGGAGFFGVLNDELGDAVHHGMA